MTAERPTAATGTADELLAALADVSRQLGSDRSVVTHGGGNTSIKTSYVDVFGNQRQALWVKRSGLDLEHVTTDDFVALDLDVVRALADLETLDDVAMDTALRAARFDPDAGGPSVESILHAVLPAPAVLHAHPSVVLAISDTAAGERRIAEVFGDDTVVVPYAMPGFQIAHLAAGAFADQNTDSTIGMVLHQHGLFTMGDTPSQAFERMTELIERAAAYLDQHGSGSSTTVRTRPPVERVGIAELRRAMSTAAGRPLIVARAADDAAWAFAQRPDIAEVANAGVVTPDHAIWTRPWPMIGRDVDAFTARYDNYVAAHRGDRDIQPLDPAPRVVVDRDYGVLTAGVTVAAQVATAEIYRQTVDVVERAEQLGGYVGVRDDDAFDMEYWVLEQRKLASASQPAAFAGEVAVVTGAASGIGRGCALSLLERGAAVVGFDISPTVHDVSDAPSYLGMVVDQGDRTSIELGLDAAVERFGGVDLLVAAAGIFPESSPIVSHDAGAWGRALGVNTTGLLDTLAAAHPLLSRAPRGGRVVVIGSKNVAAPGPGAVAYSASKAAANQVVRVAALEWAPDNIRINSVHPDAVFDTALWTPELLAERASRYEMTIDEYKRRNLLGVEVSSRAVGEAVAALLGDEFACTTGAHVTIDGGNERTI